MDADYIDSLFTYWYASQAFLTGQVERPDEGCTESENTARVGLPFRPVRHAPGFVEKLMPRDLLWLPPPGVDVMDQANVFAEDDDSDEDEVD